MPFSLPRIYLVTDDGLCLSGPLEDVVQRGVKGGAGMVQLREKGLNTRDFVERAIRLRELLSPENIPLIIHDRIDVALAAGADGVHIGQKDMPYPMARRLMGSDAIIGLSVETIEEVIQANDFDVDYLGISPVFSTPTKTDTVTEWGTEGIRTIRSLSRHPLVAIGGIKKENAGTVIRAGADCIAVVSEICASEDPARAAHDLLDACSATQNQP